MLTVFSHKRVLSGYTNDELMLLRKTKESSLKTLWLFTAPCNKTLLDRIIKLRKYVILGGSVNYCRPQQFSR